MMRNGKLEKERERIAYSRRNFFNDKKAQGIRSEEAAVRYLETRGFQVIDRNWRNRYGELDIVVKKSGNIAVVEVRSCREDVEVNKIRECTVSEFITKTKLKKLNNLALSWCVEHGQNPEKLTILLLAVTWYNSGRFSVEVVEVW